MDEIIDPTVTLKAVGHQWYWSYELTVGLWPGSSEGAQGSTATIAFDSYMLPEDELVRDQDTLGQLRLLEVDNPIYLPVGTHIRLLVTSEDVLHS